MKNATRKSSFGRLISASVLIPSAIFAAQGSMACTLDNWSTSTGAVTAGDPTGSIQRYSGFCGMETSGQGYVQDDSPGGIERIVARFYVLNGNTATSEIYAGFGSTDASDQRFSVELDNNGSVTLTDLASNQSVSQNGSTDWLSVEIDWAQGAGDGVISLSVNGQAPNELDSLGNVGTSLESVQLGNLNGAGGTLTFDAYESRRSTAVGRLCLGDADANAQINFLDVSAVFDEVSSGGAVLVSGQPDVNETGSVNFLDVTGLFDLVSTGASCAD